MNLFIACQFPPGRREFLIKSFLIMKLSAFFLILSCLQVRANSYGQKITISVKNTPVQQVFKEIEKQSDYSFIYAEEQVAKMGPVNLNLVKTDLTIVLNLVFKNQQFTYTISGNTISVMGRPSFLINDASFN